MEDLHVQNYWRSAEVESERLAVLKPWSNMGEENPLLLEGHPGKSVIRSLGWWLLVPFGRAIRILLQAASYSDGLRRARAKKL